MRKFRHIVMACWFVAAALAGPRAGAQWRSAYSELEDSETAATMRTHVQYLSAAQLEGRKAGSEGELLAAQYVAKALQSYGVQLLSDKMTGDTFGILQQGGDTLTSRNVVGEISGYDPALKDHYIVVGARLDNLGVNNLTIDGAPAQQIYYGANGNASGLAMMMELAKMLSAGPSVVRRSVLFVAFGASRQALSGSWYFLNRSFAGADKIDAMVNLDMLGLPTGFSAFTASNADLGTLLSRLEGELLPIKPEQTTQEPYPSDHRSFYSKGIPSVMFTTGQYPEHDSPRDSEDIIDYSCMERELEYIYTFVKTLASLDNAPLFRSVDASSENGRAKAYLWADCDRKPVFMGQYDPKFFLTRWVYPYLKYPPKAIEDGIQGRVVVEFVVDTKGKVTGVQVVRGVDPLLDAEAVKVISASPDWKPGLVGGKKVNTIINVPVDFRLDRKKGKIKLKK